jgi:hypothetical protein
MNEPDHTQHELGPEPAASDIAAGHEVSDVNISGLVTFLVGLMVSLAAVVFIIAGFFWFLGERAAKHDPAPPPLAEMRPKQPPAPRLQASPATEMNAMLDQQEAALRQTKWIDKEQKVVRIPIDRAMQLVVERGLPNWPRVEVDAKPTGEKSPAANPSKQDAASKRGTSEEK